jgi:hypothetical protein
MTDKTSLKVLAQRVMSRSNVGQGVGQAWDKGCDGPSQTQQRVGRLNPAENCHFGQASHRPITRDVGRWDGAVAERDSAWDSSGTTGHKPSGYDEESGLPIDWLEGYRQLVMRRPGPFRRRHGHGYRLLPANC